MDEEQSGLLSLPVDDMAYLDDNIDQFMMEPAYLNSDENNIERTLVCSGCIRDTKKTLMSSDDEGMPLQYHIYRVMW